MRWYMNNKYLYEKIMRNISKQIKHILNEDIQNFDVTDYEEDEDSVLDQQEVSELLYYPFTILLHVKKCPFGIYGTNLYKIKREFLKRYEFEPDNIIIEEYDEYKYPDPTDFTVEYIFKVRIEDADMLRTFIQFMRDNWKDIIGSYTSDLSSILTDGKAYYTKSIEGYLRKTMKGIKECETDKFVEAVKDENLYIWDFKR